MAAQAVRQLPSDREDRARPVLAEPDHLAGRRARWRFPLGCGPAVVVEGTGPERPALGRHAAVPAGVVAAAGLVAYGLVRYPGLRSEGGILPSPGVFAGMLAGYALVSLAYSWARPPHAGTAWRCGAVAAVAVAGLWLAAVGGLRPVPGSAGLLLGLAQIVPLVLSALATRLSGSAAAGVGAALWTALLGGLTVFIVFVTATYAADGRPYDPALVRGLGSRGAPGLATVAVASDLGGGLSLLVTVPALALASGCIGTALARAGHRSSPGT